MSKSIIFLIFLVSFFVLSASPIPTRDSIAQSIVEMRNGRINLINPLLDCYELNHSSLRDMMILEDKIKLEINNQYKKGNAARISVYYRELKNGHWIGMGENEKYSPASLLKLPILIAGMKQAELDSNFLKIKVKIDTQYSNYLQMLGNNNYSLEVGKSYTIEELMTNMIVYSDNQSKDIVLNHINQKILANVFYDLGIDIFKYHNFEKSLSVKEYASYYRILYNATYLNKEHSNKALEILTRTRFKLGLVAGIPDSVTIAHKFGERDFGEKRQKQLHDCGIVYSENNPYIICVMAVGNEYRKLEESISTISRIVYSISETKNRR